jgi:hypothetical protein
MPHNSHVPRWPYHKCLGFTPVTFVIQQGSQACTMEPRGAPLHSCPPDGGGCCAQHFRVHAPVQPPTYCVLLACQALLRACPQRCSTKGMVLRCWSQKPTALTAWAASSACPSSALRLWCAHATAGCTARASCPCHAAAWLAAVTLPGARGVFIHSLDMPLSVCTRTACIQLCALP